SLVVAGSLAAVLLGGVEGAVAGAALSGVLGWLLGLGISREKILKYEEAVKAGKFLVVAHGPAEQVERAREILAASRPEKLDRHDPEAAQPAGVAGWGRRGGGPGNATPHGEEGKRSTRGPRKVWGVAPPGPASPPTPRA